MAEPKPALRRLSIFLRSRMRRELLLRVAMGGAFCSIVLASTAWKPRPALVWNASPSSPEGLYLIQSSQHAAVGEYVIAWAPHRARRLAAERHYIPLNVPLVKRVAARAGDEVCANGEIISVNGGSPERRRPADDLGRPMPYWEGCTRLGSDEFFLFDPAQADAFDGRYFGVTKNSQLIGKATLIWRG